MICRLLLEKHLEMPIVSKYSSQLLTGMAYIIPTETCSIASRLFLGANQGIHFDPKCLKKYSTRTSEGHLSAIWSCFGVKMFFWNPFSDALPWEVKKDSSYQTKCFFQCDASVLEIHLYHYHLSGVILSPLWKCN